jgi:hypothetical protein
VEEAEEYFQDTAIVVVGTLWDSQLQQEYRTCRANVVRHTCLHDRHCCLPLEAEAAVVAAEEALSFPTMVEAVRSC